MIKNFLKVEKGQALVEFALLFGLCACAVLGVLTLTGKKVNRTFHAANQQMQIVELSGATEIRLNQVLSPVQKLYSNQVKCRRCPVNGELRDDCDNHVTHTPR